MRLFTTTTILIFVAFCVAGQDSGVTDEQRNRKPKITGQQDLEVNEEGTITLRLTNLRVRDRDDFLYPLGFTMRVYPGNNYTFQELAITPVKNFNGTLTVPVTVNDGEDDSEKFDLKISVRPVNDPPTITGQNALSIEAGTSLVLAVTNLIISDPDDSYPNDFTLEVPASNSGDYTVSGKTVTPRSNFSGWLTVPVRVSDGQVSSAPFDLKIQVGPAKDTPGNDAPVFSEFETDALVFAPGMEPVAISKVAEIFDPDSETIASAQIEIHPEQYQIGVDELIFENTSSITGVFHVETGRLVLTGPASLKDFEAAVRSVQYNFNFSLQPPIREKTISLSLNDGTSTGPPTQRRIKLVDEEIVLEIPNAFTPNGDLANDIWSIKPLKESEILSTAIVRVYNRRGSMVFEGSGFEKGWDGRTNGELLPADTYYYTINFGNVSHKFFHGTLLLLR